MNTSLQKLNINIPISSLDAYVSYVYQIPLLSHQEEIDLATDLQKNQNLEAARRLVLSHARYVVRVAKGYIGYGLPLNDLIQEGNIGLMKAVKRFDPSMGVRLVTFAVHWIKSEIHEFIIRNWRIVKVATTKAQRKLFFNLRSAKKRLGWFTQEEMNAVAEDLGVKPETVREMEMRLNAIDAPFDGDNEDDEDSYFCPAGYLEDHRYSPTQQFETHPQTHSKLHHALMQLDPRSQAILTARWLADDEEKATLQELADQYDVSAERIRQLEKNAMQKLKIALEGVV